MIETAELVEIGPQPGPQEASMASTADIVITGGAAGGGKTYGLLLESIRHHDKQDVTAVIFRRTYPQIVAPGGLWAESMELFPLFGAEPKVSIPPKWTFPSGFELHFNHLQHEKDRLTWKGSQLCFIGFDQVEEFLESQFWYLMGRNRSISGVRPYLRATCNPVPEDDPVGGWLHKLIGWWIDQKSGLPILERSGVIRWFRRIKDELIWFDRREDHEQPELAKSITFIPSCLADNPILDEKDPGYRANLEALPLVERERLLGGNWKIRATAGKVFNRAWFAIVRAAPTDAARVRYWDKAATKDGGAYTAGVRMSAKNGIYYVEDVVRGQWSAGQRNQVIKQVAKTDGKSVRVWVEQEPGSGGKESAEFTIQELAGYDVRAERPTGDKTERAMPLSAQAEAGNVVLVGGEWNEAFLTELQNFPEGAYKDQVDGSSGAFNKLALSSASGRADLVTL